MDEMKRKKVHLWAAVFAVVVLMAGILSAPSCRRSLAHRQYVSIQRSVTADLYLVRERELAFYKKHQSYTTDLKSLGIAPKAVVYKFGFVKASDPKLVELADHDPARKDLDALKAALPGLKIAYSPITQLAQISFDQLAGYCSDCTAGKASFKVVAAANLDADPVLDIWTIDQEGAVAHLIDDLSQ